MARLATCRVCVIARQGPCEVDVDEIDTFFSGVCAGLALSVTRWRLGVFGEWNHHEGMPLWTFNPIATTQPGRRSTKDIGWGPGKWNNANPPYGVGIYADMQAGVDATVATLTNGYYPNVLACLRDQVGYQEAVKELATYVGSVAYGQQLVNFMNESDEPKTDWVEDMTEDEVKALIKGMQDTGALASTTDVLSCVAQIVGSEPLTYSDAPRVAAVRKALGIGGKA